MNEAADVDARADAGEDVGPLCGLSILVKDLFDVTNYTTAAGTPSLQSESAAQSLHGCTIASFL